MSKYIKNERKGQILFIICILLAIIIGILWNVMEEDSRAVKPDMTFPMTNVNISWEQTFHGGAWNE